MFSSDPRSGRKNQPAYDEAAWSIVCVILTLGNVGVLPWMLGTILDPWMENSSNNPVQNLME